MDAALVAFAVVFVAELGDKTQLVALGLAARYPLPVVLVGIGLAYTATQGLAALLGGALGAALPTTALGIGAAVLFFAFAAWTLVDVLRADDGGDGVAGAEVDSGAAAAARRADGGAAEVEATADEAADHMAGDTAEVESAADEAAEEVEAVVARVGGTAGRSSLAVVGGIVVAMVLAEIGDKSMLATATIAAERGALGAWVGATLGIMASGGLAVVVGRVMGARIPERATGLVSAALFALFGVLLLVETVT